jgi:hypothetical protein
MQIAVKVAKYQAESVSYVGKKFSAHLSFLFKQHQKRRARNSNKQTQTAREKRFTSRVEAKKARVLRSHRRCLFHRRLRGNFRFFLLWANSLCENIFRRTGARAEEEEEEDTFFSNTKRIRWRF